MEDKDREEILRDEEGYYSACSDYSKILRTWLVAYGVGGPVLFLTQNEISNKIIESGQARFIVYLFLLGVLFQVVISLLNKWVNWYLYAFVDPESRKHKKLYATADWVSNQFWIDILFDIGSIITFGLATMRVLLIFTGP